MKQSAVLPKVEEHRAAVSARDTVSAELSKAVCLFLVFPLQISETSVGTANNSSAAHGGLQADIPNLEKYHLGRVWRSATPVRCRSTPPANVEPQANS